MKNRFLIPVTAALALHAALLFGFRTPPGTLTHRRPDELGRVEKDPDLVQVIYPDNPEEQGSPNAPSSPAAAPPEITEPPAIERPGVVTIPDYPVKSDSTPVDATMPKPFSGPGTGPDELGGPSPIFAAQLDNPPRTRAQVSPVYPYEARVAGRSGEVVVEFMVDESGRVVDPRVVRSSDPLFEAPTLRAVAKWRFEPGRRNGHIVRFRMAVPVSYAVNS